MFIYDMYVLFSAILFCFAFYKLNNTSMKISDLLGFVSPTVLKDILRMKFGINNKKTLVFVLGLHLFSCLLLRLTLGSIYLAKGQNDLVIMLWFCAFVFALMVVGFLGIIYLHMIYFSLLVLLKNTMNIKRYYVLKQIQKKDFNYFIDKKMSYDTLNKIETIIGAKYLDESICEQLILLCNLFDDDAFKKSNSKEVIDFIKSVDELISAVNRDYFRNKENNLKEREKVLINNMGSVLSDIAKGNEYLKNAIK